MRKRGISAIVSVVLLIAIVILAATGLYFWLGGLATKQPTTEKAIVITATVLNPANGTIAIVVLDGTFTGQYLNTTDGTLCDFGESVTLTQGQQDTCTAPPKEGTTILYGPDVGQTSVQMSPSEVADITMQASGGSASTWTQSSMADFAGGGFSDIINGSLILNNTNASDYPVIEGQAMYNPSLAMFTNGDYIVTWANGQGTGNGDIYAKVYHSNGSIRNISTRINTNVSQLEELSNVDVSSNGEYAVVWHSYDGTSFTAYVRSFYSNHSAKGSDFLTGSASSSEAQGPGAAVDSQGNFVTVSGSGSSIFARVWWANNSARTSAITVSDNTTGDRRPAKAAFNASSDYFLVVWHDSRSGNYDIYGKYFWANGSNFSNEFVANTVTAGAQTYPDVAFDSSGNHVIAWTSSAKAYYANRTNRTNDFSGQSRPSVGFDGNGNYVIAGGTSEATATAFWANDSVRTASFRLNSDTTGTQEDASVGVRSDGSYVVAWEDDRVNSNIYSARIFANDTFENTTTATVTTGNYTSSIQDTGSNNTQFNGTFTATDTRPTLTNITYWLFFSNFSNFATNTTEYVDKPDSSISQTSRYVRYRATLTTSDKVVSPRISSVSLTYRQPTFSLTYTINYASGIGWAYVNQTCSNGNNTFTDGPNNVGGATFYSRTLSNLATSCNYTSFANTTTGGVIGVQTYNP
jgi:flagellin-like protein